jgi:uncharacterized protein
MAERYPREMTVVLQHQFYNLIVTEDRFQVELSFDNIPEKLIIPFAAVKGFLDPAVQFGLQFEVTHIDPADQPVESSVKTKSKLEREVPAVETADTAKPEDAPKVVSLDAFRKK